jgi:hypothetical protein
VAFSIGAAAAKALAEPMPTAFPAAMMMKSAPSWRGECGKIHHKNRRRAGKLFTIARGTAAKGRPAWNGMLKEPDFIGFRRGVPGS